MREHLIWLGQHGPSILSGVATAAAALVAGLSALATLLNRMTPHHAECARWRAGILRWLDRLAWVQSRGVPLALKLIGRLSVAPGGTGPTAPPPAVLALACLLASLAGCGAWSAAVRSTSDRWAADVAAVSAPSGRDAAIAWARSLSRRLLDRACAEDLMSGTVVPHPDCATLWREAGLRSPSSRPAE